MAGGVWNEPSDGVIGVPVFGAFCWGRFRRVGVVQAWTVDTFVFEAGAAAKDG